MERSRTSTFIPTKITIKSTIQKHILVDLEPLNYSILQPSFEHKVH